MHSPAWAKGMMGLFLREEQEVSGFDNRIDVFKIGGKYVVFGHNSGKLIGNYTNIETNESEGEEKEFAFVQNGMVSSFINYRAERQLLTTWDKMPKEVNWSEILRENPEDFACLPIIFFTESEAEWLKKFKRAAKEGVRARLPQTEDFESVEEFDKVIEENSKYYEEIVAIEKATIEAAKEELDRRETEAAIAKTKACAEIAELYSEKARKKVSSDLATAFFKGGNKEVDKVYDDAATTIANSMIDEVVAGAKAQVIKKVIADKAEKYKFAKDEAIEYAAEKGVRNSENRKETFKAAKEDAECQLRLAVSDEIGDTIKIDELVKQAAYNEYFYEAMELDCQLPIYDGATFSEEVYANYINLIKGNAQLENLADKAAENASTALFDIMNRVVDKCVADENFAKELTVSSVSVMANRILNEVVEAAKASSEEEYNELQRIMREKRNAYEEQLDKYDEDEQESSDEDDQN